MPSDQPIAERNYHFDTEEVLRVVMGTDILRDNVRRRLLLITSRERFSLYRAIAKLIDSRAEAELAAMTEDRNLWRDAHDEDCPNLAMLETVQQERDLLKQQLAAAVGPDLSPALEAAEAVALADENERLRRVLIDIGHGVKLMVPEPQQSGLMRMIDAALAPAAQPSAEGTEAADGKA